MMLEVREHHCSTWDEIAKCLAGFPAPEISVDADDGGSNVIQKTWAFRGLKKFNYKLQPSIEREAHSKNICWAALELLVLAEFKSRARMHLSPALIPRDGDQFTWLAVMQHYGVPTRLLDFTYSPFIGLYFALRNRHVGEERFRVWAIDAQAVNKRFKRVDWEAVSEERKRKGLRTGHKASFHPDDFASDRDLIADETEGMRNLIAESLSAAGTRRGELNRNGCVCAASPPAFNQRLSSQQGLFLINCAQDLCFEKSLRTMMKGCEEWGQTFDIAAGAAPEIERQLFQMNIHEQSLFPDMEGLAGLIHQKIRLHWK
jgi:hypothetical protein